MLIHSGYIITIGLLVAYCRCQSNIRVELPGTSPQYVCNNQTFDWLMKTMVAKIAEQIDMIDQLEYKAQNLNQKLGHSNEALEETVKKVKDTEVEVKKACDEQISHTRRHYVQEISKLKIHKQKERLRPMDCADTQQIGYRYSGLHMVYPTHILQGYQVFCDLQTDSGGWLVIQRRQDGSQSFQQNWQQYKQGFGQPASEFWIGNDFIHHITQQRHYELRIDLTDFKGHTYQATYDGFKIAAEDESYRITLGNYEGNAGDSFSHHSEQAFSTVDSDHDNSRSGNCAQLYGGGGWWYDRCYDSNLNGLYGSPQSNQGVVWYHLYNDHSPLMHVEMKIRPVNFKAVNQQRANKVDMTIKDEL